MAIGRTGRRRRVIAVIFTMGLIAASSPSAFALVATMTLDPMSGAPGIQVTVHGSGHTANPNLDVEIRWGTDEGPLLGVTPMSGSGTYTAMITIPGGASPGAHTVVACEVTGGLHCADLKDSEFYVSASASFTVVAATTTTTTSTTTTSTTSTTVPGTTTSTTLIPVDVELPSIVGTDDLGLWGPFVSAIDGIESTIFVPRCYPPEGATVLDFDTDVGSPSAVGRPEIGFLAGRIAEPSAGTISPRHAVWIGTPTPDDPRRWVVTFTEPQRYVGFFVGDPNESAPIIDLIGYDADGHVVARDRILGAHAAVDTCMALQAADPTITQVLLVGEAGLPLEIDKLFYSDTGEITSTPAARGTVTFLRPTNDQELSTRVRQIVTGTIRVPAALPIEEVTLAVPRWDRSRTDLREIDFGPLWRDGDDQLYLFSASGIYLPEGESWITVTATGPGVLASGIVPVIGVGTPPLHPEEVERAVDVEPITIEVNQAERGQVDLIDPGATIQERDDTVLVHNKKTVVRGFGRLVFPNGETYSGTIPVNAELIGTRNGTALPGSPLSPTHVTTDLKVWTDRRGAYDSQKQQTDLSWNFVLPDSWTDVGSIDLRLVVNSPVLPGHVDELEGYDGAVNEIGLSDVVFRSKNAPGVNIWLVDYYYRCAAEDVDGDPDTFRAGSGASRTPSAGFCAGLSEGDIVHAQPTPTLAADAVRESWNMAPFPGAFPGRFDLWEYTFATDGVPDSALEPGPLLTPGSPQERFWLGVALRMDVIVGVDGYNNLNALMTSFIRGKAWGSPSFFRVATWPSTFLHEAGHTMGLRHTGNGHGESFWIARWSGDHGQIAFDVSGASSFDTLRMQALPYPGLHDLMSYGDWRWVSYDVWTHIEDAVGSGFARVDNRVDEDAARFLGEVFGDAPAGDDEIVTVAGGITGDDVALDPGFNLAGGVLVSGGGEIVLRVLAADGSLLSESQTPLLAGSDDPNEPTGFIAPVFVPAGAVQLVVLRDGVEIDRKPIGPKPDTPVAPSITDPIGAEGTLELSWNDAGDGVQYLVEVTRDDETWFPIAVTTEPRASIDAGRLPFQGDGWRLRIQASSGLNLAISDPVEVSFTPRPRTPMIVLPGDGDVVATNTFIDLQAAVSQFSEGDEDGYVWDMDGTRIGEGATGTTFTDDPGDHVITVTAPSGASSSITVHVMVDSDLDGMSDEWERQWGFDPENPGDAAVDADGDGVPAWQEFERGSSPQSIDTDGDLYSDEVEVVAWTDPSDPSSFPEVWVDGGPAPRIEGAAPQPPAEEPAEGGSPVGMIIAIAAAAAAASGAGVWWFLRRRA
jgi:hypothetical protein